MSTVNFGVNIDAAAIMAQYDSEATQTVIKKKNVFDLKNYLNTRLSPEEKSKKLTIRLLPWSPTVHTPFYKVHMHQVRVNKEVSASGWKTFVCPTGNKGEDGNPLGTSCPFCDISASAREQRFKVSDESLRKNYGDIEFMNRKKEMWIVRCIERGHEEDGVKFWLFPTNKKKDGVYDKIFSLYKSRLDDDINIFDLVDGKDLILNIERGSDGKTTIQVVDKGKSTPLCENEEVGRSWINDEKKWTDVYTVKSAEYMSIIVENGVPKWDKELNCYYDATKDSELKEEADRQRLEEAITPQTRDYSTIVNGGGSQVIDGTQYDTSDPAEDSLPF